jgi:enamine deaminase RidA (YjgF/YER057c/UK114 family)
MQSDAAGQTRLADQNRLVLKQLDARIAQIKDSLTATQPASQAGRDAS